ncbi:peptidoglycan DD-metalloendopeptidase family protein [Patescibacteria group bacterium]|nr:peptidoglycan DD-metalloendopeptidase family protein [Patescibacteria group bacterium]
MAQTYGMDDYTNNNLLSALVTPTEAGWSELIEETGPATSEPIAMNKIFEEQGALQELIIPTPFPEEVFIEASTDTSPDQASLVQISPQDTEIPQRTQTVVYTVKNGDVLGSIAEQFGISVNTILWENNLTWNSTIKAGQQLSILPQSGIEHEVKSGDTILAIAKKYQVEADSIIKNNSLADATDIRSGDLLFIPNGIKPTAITSSYTPKTPVKNTPPKVVDVYSDEEVAGSDNETNTKLLWPVISQRITQYYHWGHSGLDIGDKTGNPIYAAESGKVERSGWSTGYGYNVVINHGNGLTTLYGHASKLLVKAGDTVTRGETIALVGSTGWSTGPHIHFEVRTSDVKKNPLNYIK